jgi:hypothetical protein
MTVLPKTAYFDNIENGRKIAFIKSHKIDEK